MLVAAACEVKYFPGGLCYWLMSVCHPLSEQCTQKSDVAFVIDSSGSISRTNFQKEKDFVKEVASTFKMGPDQSQIAVISYSDDAQIDVKFGEYSNVNDFNAAVDSVKHQRRRTRIDLALDLAVSGLFTPEGGARPNVAKVMIILTDGKQTNMSGSKSLDVAVRPLQKINVTIFAVGVGNAIDINELLHLVGDNEENLFRARNFNELARDSLRLASRTCKRIKPPIGEETVPLLTTRPIPYETIYIKMFILTQIKLILYERFCTKNRFETDTQGHPEMVA